MSIDFATVKVPRIDLVDKVAFGMTARQLLYAATTVALLLTTWRILVPLVPMPVAGGLCALLALLGAVLAFVRRDGASADVLLLAALRMPRRPLIAAPGGVTAAPAWMNAVTSSGQRHVRPGVLRSPAAGVDADGTIDLGPSGNVAVLEVAGGLANFGLLSGAEQSVLVTGFTHALHSLTGPIQVLITATHADLTAYADSVEETAQALPDSVAAAGRAHVRALRDMKHNADVGFTRRHVLVAVPGRTREQLARRVDEVVAALANCGLTTASLTAGDVIDLLAVATDPFQFQPENPK